MRNSYVILICIVVWTSEAFGQGVRVKTLSGEVQGFEGETCRSKTKYFGFRGIPYAEPPLGDLRFRAPVPKFPWTEVWNATYQRPSCIQGTFGDDDEMGVPSNTDEDCLYLNLYTPNVKYFTNKLTPLKAVMVFIHMGAFVMGSSSETYLSPDFLLDEDVVVVTFNYRLGALGFLSLQNADVPGNAGLKDQTLALKWVKDNVRIFGGDPNKITIFGESAGSASVNYHMISKLSQNLFRSVIMQSGTATATWAYSPPELALKKSMMLANKVGCPQKDLTELLDCMRTVPAEAIKDYQLKALTLEEMFSFRVIAFHPTTEPDLPGAFITVPPFDLMFSGNFTKVPAIIGSTADEGLLLYPAFMKLDPKGYLLTLMGMDLSRFAPYQFHIKPLTKLSIQVHMMISKFYFNGQSLNKNMLFKVLDLFTDTMFVLPIQMTAGLLADASVPVYNYLFSYDGVYALGKVSTNIANVTGVCHGDDVGYLFYTPELHKNCGRNVSEATALDELMINRLTKMWTNFAKTGNPTPSTSAEIPVIWKRFTSTERNYLNIGKDLVLADSLKLAKIAFWDELVQKILDSTLDGVNKVETFGDLY